VAVRIGGRDLDYSGGAALVDRTLAVEVRSFARRDLERVLAIERDSFGKDAWPAELFIEYWRASPELFLIAKQSRKIAGYSIARTDWRGAELESIAVDHADRGRGVAQALLKATIARLRSQGAGTLRLMVSTTNESALRFYQRSGFIRVRKVKRYYGAGRDAWRMRLKLPRSRPK
jgi:[ribosomal protein S18]-alanine N-acetyltransferase